MRSYKTFDHGEARRMHAKGMTYKQIGEVLGVSDQTIALHLNPERQRQKQTYMRRLSREKRAAKNALIEKERDKAIRATQGAPAEAYALLRRTALVIDKAISEAEDAATRTKLTAALGFTHKAEDEIVRALRLERTLPERPVIIKRKSKA
jgi:lipopolysaccharide biosynthesis regulator YciM